MTYDIAFILSIGILILVFIKILSIIVRRPIRLPGGIFDPSNWWLFYPALFFQIYHWTNYFNLINM